MRKYLTESRKYKGVHYKELQPEMLAYLHRRSLEMLREVTGILSRNKIQYMICGGTLLGAVTTGKFIPWDDDVDMCVLEADYARMTECLIRELPEGMVFQCAQTERKYYHGWGKVRDQRSKTFPGEALYKENGVWIDIYKLVPMKKNEASSERTKEHIDYLKRRYSSGSISCREYWNRVKKNRLVWKFFAGRLQYVFGLNRKKICVLRSASGIILDEDWCVPVREYEFEGLKLTGFGMGEKYLIQHYGNDYRKLPPEELRRISISRIEMLHR